MRLFFENGEPKSYVRIISRASQHNLKQAQVDYLTYIQRTSNADLEKVRVFGMNIGCINMGHGGYRPGYAPPGASRRNPPPEEEVLGIRSKTSLTELVGQTTSTFFFSHAVSYLENIGGRYEISRLANDPARLVLRNTVIEKLAENFAGSGLGSEDEALLCIIPALKRQGKLHNLTLEEVPQYNVDGKAECALVEFARHGDKVRLKRLLEGRAHLAIREEWMSMALMRAVEMDHTAVARMLLEKRPQLEKQTAILVATERGNVELVKHL